MVERFGKGFEGVSVLSVCALCKENYGSAKEETSTKIWPYASLVVADALLLNLEGVYIFTIALSLGI